MNKKYLIGGGVVAIVVVAVAAWFLFLQDDAPDEVDVGAADDALSELLEETPADETPADENEPDETPAEDPVEETPVPEGIDGVWVIDDEIGVVEFEEATGSFAGFRVAEELIGVGDVTAVGRSGGINGTVTIEGGTLGGAEVTVNMTTIVSNDSRRENAIRRAINATDFPDAVFTFDAGGVDVSAIEVGGAAQSFEVEGQLTVAGVTNPATFAIDALVRDDGFAVMTGNTEITWEDFGVTPPSAPIVASIADEGIVEFQLILSR